MRVFVTFQPNKKAPEFEGTRLRKNIKAALELNNIRYATNYADVYDVAHYIYMEPDSRLNDVIERNVPTICSALYCEDDPNASFLDYHNKDGNRSVSLKSKALKFLNKMDLILVPTESAKEILISNNVETPIEICHSGVNLARFDFSRYDEKELFYRYFGENKNTKLVVAMGEYTYNMDGINAFVNAAIKCPNSIFYYIGCEDAAFKFSKNLKRIIAKAPKNVKFKATVPEDIYRSMLLNADVFMFPGYRPAGIVSLLEAMAAKCQLIVRKQAICPKMLIDGETAYIAEYSETLTELVKSYLQGDLKPTIDNAYRSLEEYSLKTNGEQLINIYQKIINKKTRGEY